MDPQLNCKERAKLKRRQRRKEAAEMNRDLARMGISTTPGEPLSFLFLSLPYSLSLRYFFLLPSAHPFVPAG